MRDTGILTALQNEEYDTNVIAMMTSFISK